MMLLVAHFLALGVAVMVFFWMIFLHRQNCMRKKSHNAAGEIFLPHAAFGDRPLPTTWLAIRSLESETVREALPDQDQFFVSPRRNGWVIVIGSGLPSPSDDVDACFRFLIAISGKLGHVQFFHVEKFTTHHAWARMDYGCVTRAYAWAGETIWNQGSPTLAENGLGMRCPAYGEDAGTGSWTTKEAASANVEKILLLAARWSIDPEIFHRTDGLAGESSRPY